MKTFILFAAMFTVFACGENSGSQKLEDPQEVQPPSDAIPDSMKIVNDSLIVPDSANAR